MPKKACDGWWISILRYGIIIDDQWPLDKNLNGDEKNEFGKKYKFFA